MDGGRELEPLLEVIGIVRADLTPYPLGRPGADPLLFSAPPSRCDEHERGLARGSAEWIVRAGRVVAVCLGFHLFLGANLPAGSAVGDICGRRDGVDLTIPTAELHGFPSREAAAGDGRIRGANQT